MNMLLILISVALICLSLLLTVRPYIPSPIPAYVAMWTLRWAGAVIMPQSLLIGWGAVTAVMVLIEYMQPPAISKATNGTVYMSVGALTCTPVAVSAMPASATLVWIVAGAIGGALAGAVVYGRTRAAAPLQFPSRRFWNYTVAKIFPTAITYTLLGLIAFSIIISNSPTRTLINLY